MSRRASPAGGLNRQGVTVTIVAIVLSALLGFLSSAQPTIAALAIVAMGFVLMAMARPSACIAWCAAAYVVVLPLPYVLPVAGVSALDEAATLGAVFAAAGWLFRERTWPYMPPFFVLFLIFASIELLSSFISDGKPSIFLPSILLFIKGPLVGWAASQVPWSNRSLGRLYLGLEVAVAALLVGAMAQLALPKTWNPIFTRLDPGARFGFPAATSFFDHPGLLAQVAGVLTICLAARRVVSPKQRPAFFLITAALLTLASLRRRAVLGVLAAVTPTLMATRKSRRITTAALTILSAPLSVVSFSVITSVFSMTQHEYFSGRYDIARIRLYVDALRLGTEHFPLGLGGGQFGSFYSAIDYSSVYRTLGYTSVYGLRPGDSFFTDTYWPAVVAEGGLIGSVCVAAAILTIGATATRLIRAASSEDWDRVLGFTLIGVLVFSLIDSIAAPTYSAPPMAGVVFAIAGIATSRRRRAQARQIEVREHGVHEGNT